MCVFVCVCVCVCDEAMPYNRVSANRRYHGCSSVIRGDSLAVSLTSLTRNVFIPSNLIVDQSMVVSYLLGS